MMVMLVTVVVMMIIVMLSDAGQVGQKLMPLSQLRMAPSTTVELITNYPASPREGPLHHRGANY